MTATTRQEFDSRLALARSLQADRDAKALSAKLGDLIATMRPDRDVSVVAVGLDRIERVSAYLDSMGSPQVRQLWQEDWTSLLPMLPADGPDRRARLLGGVAGLDDRRIAELVRDRLPSVGGGGTGGLPPGRRASARSSCPGSRQLLSPAR